MEDKVDFRPWKLALKIEKCCFLTALNQKVLQGIKKSLEDVHLDAKIYWILPASLWNSTTVIMLTSMLIRQKLVPLWLISLGYSSAIYQNQMSHWSYTFIYLYGSTKKTILCFPTCIIVLNNTPNIFDVISMTLFLTSELLLT